MLPRKHYQAVSAAVARAPLYGVGASASEIAAACGAYESVIAALADAFAADNPRFDRGRFLAACSFDKG